MRSRVITGAVIIATLAAAGGLANWQTRHVWQEIRSHEPALDLTQVGAGAGHGISLGLLGGFRALAADLLWVRMNTAWERQDLPQTQSLILLATAIDPRPLYFWINGARMMAYDMPVWRNGSADLDGAMTEDEKEAIDRQQAEIALEFLNSHPRPDTGNAWIEIEKGNILLWRLNDLEAAAEHYRRASAMEGAPYFAARIYAEFLKKLGRFQEAYDWLVELFPTLPSDQRDAMADVVLKRIRQLEKTLGIDEAERFRPAERSGKGSG